MTFGTLIRAQALGDYEALVARDGGFARASVIGEGITFIG